MLYLDVPLPIKSIRPNELGQHRGVSLGRRYRPRGPDYVLGVPPQLDGHRQISPGLHLDLTVSRDRSKPMHILAALEEELYIVLTSRLTHANDHIGNIRVPRTQKARITARAKAIPGTGRWETIIFHARVGDAYYVNWNHPTGTSAHTAFYYVAALDQVYACPHYDIPRLCTDFDLHPDFTVRHNPDPNIAHLDYREWYKA